MIWYDKGTKFTWHSDVGAGQQLDPMSMLNGDQHPADVDMSGSVPNAQPVDRVAAAQAANDEMLRQRAELARQKAQQLAQNVYRDANYAHQVNQHAQEAGWRAQQNPQPWTQQVHQAFLDRQQQAHQQMGVHNENWNGQRQHLDRIAQHASALGHTDQMWGDNWFDARDHDSGSAPRGQFQQNHMRGQDAFNDDESVQDVQPNQPIYRPYVPFPNINQPNQPNYKPYVPFPNIKQPQGFGQPASVPGFDFQNFRPGAPKRQPDFVADQNGNIFDLFEEQKREFEKQQAHHDMYDTLQSGASEAFLAQEFYDWEKEQRQRQQNQDIPYLAQVQLIKEQALREQENEYNQQKQPAPVQRSNFQPFVGPQMNKQDAYDQQYQAAQVAQSQEDIYDRLRIASLGFVKANDEMMRGNDPGAQARAEKFQREKFDLVQQLGQKEQEASYLHGELGDLKMQNASIQAELETARKELQQARIDMEWYQHKNYEDQMLAQKYRNMESEKERKISQLEEEVKELQALAKMEPEQRSRALISEENARRRAEHNVKQLTEQIQSLNLDLKNLDIKMQTKEREFQLHKEETLRIIGERDEALAAASDDLEKMTNYRNIAIQRNHAITTENYTQKDTITELQEQRQKLDAQIKRDKQEAESRLSMILAQTDREINEARIDAQRVKDKLIVVELTLAQTTIERDVLQKKADNAQQLLDQMANEMQIQTDKYTAEIQQYKLDIDNVKVDDQGIKRTVVELREAIKLNEEEYLQKQEKWEEKLAKAGEKIGTLQNVIAIHKDESERQLQIAKEATASVELYKEKMLIMEQARAEMANRPGGPQQNNADIDQMKAKVAQVDALIAEQKRLADEAAAQRVAAEQKLSLVEREMQQYQELALRDPTRNIPLVAKAVRDYLQKKNPIAPLGLMQVDASFDDAIALLRQSAPSFTDVSQNSLYNGLMDACVKIQQFQQDEFQRTGQLGKFNVTLQEQLKHAEMRAQALEGKFNQIGIYDSGGVTTLKQQINDYSNENTQQKQLIFDLEEQLQKQKAQLEISNQQYQKQFSDFVYADNQRVYLQEQQQAMVHEWNIMQQRMMQMEEAYQRQYSEMMAMNEKLHSLNSENADLYRKNWALANQSEMDDEEKIIKEREMQKLIEQKQIEMQQSAEAIQQMLEFQEQRELEQANNAKRLAEHENKLQILLKNLQEKQQYISDQESDILQTEYNSIHSSDLGTIMTRPKAAYARDKISENTIIEGLSGNISAANLGKLPFQPPIIKPVMRFQELSTKMTKIDPMNMNAPWITEISDWTSTDSTHQDSFYDRPKFKSFYKATPGQPLPNRKVLDVVDEEFGDETDTVIAENDAPPPPPSDPMEPVQRPAGAVVMQQVVLAPPWQHVSKVAQAARASQIGQGVANANANAHQVAADLVSNAVKSHKTIVSGEQPQADVLSKYQNSLASKVQPQGAKASQFFRAGELERLKAPGGGASSIGALQPQADVLSQFANSLASRAQPQGAKAGQFRRSGEQSNKKDRRTPSGASSKSKSIKRPGGSQSVKLPANLQSAFNRAKVIQKASAMKRGPQSASMQALLKRIQEEKE